MSSIIGFSSSFFNTNSISIEEKVSRILSFEQDAIELCFNFHPLSEISYSSSFISQVASFKYRAFHLPCTFRYPSAESEVILANLPDYLSLFKPHTIIAHPDIVDDFSYLNEKLGSLLAYENMEIGRSYGRTTNELSFVFARAPQAHLVLDLNHVYTFDPTLQLAEELIQAFGERIAHYHVSGCLKDKHACLHHTHQTNILDVFAATSQPAILEGGSPFYNDMLTNEFEYVTKYSFQG